MTRTKLLLLTSCVLSIILCAGVALIGGPKHGSAGAPEELTWLVTQARVTNPGATATLTEGVLTAGRQVEAVAATHDLGDYRTASFLLTYSILRHYRPGFDGERWSLDGRWRLRDPQTGEIIARGRLAAELPYDPLTAENQGQTLAANLLPPAGAHRRQAGRGIYTGLVSFEGRLAFQPELWSLLAQSEE